MAHRSVLLIVLLVGMFVLMTGLLVTGGAIAREGGQSCAVPEGYATIQAAVDDAGCKLVIVGKGTFNENVIISRTVRIAGQGAAHTIVDGGGDDDVFKIQAWAEMNRPLTMTVTLADLRIVNGQSGIFSEAKIADWNGYANGSAILYINIKRCAINDNSGSGLVNRPFHLGQTEVQVSSSDAGGNQGWGVENVPDMFGTADLKVANSVISDNSGGGIANWGCIKGLCDTTLDVSGSTISGNGGSGIDNWVTVAHVTHSTISGNTAVEGGGINNGVGALTHVSNSTIGGNTAEKGGGISSVCGSIHLANSTVSDNSAGLGGGIYIMGESDPYLPYECFGFVDATNSIVANSEKGGECIVDNDEWAAFIDKGHNIVEDGSCIAAPSSRSGDPLLGPLTDNGGATLTHALLPKSPAVDGGDTGSCPETDQRGFPRPGDGDGDGTAVCDIGSFELLHSFHLPLIMSVGTMN